MAPPSAGIDPGRRLVFSPDWGEQCVVFDARSGDFWVVSRDVWAALRSVAVDPAASPGPIDDLPAEIVDNLQAHGIIQASRTR